MYSGKDGHVCSNNNQMDSFQHILCDICLDKKGLPGFIIPCYIERHLYSDSHQTQKWWNGTVNKHHDPILKYCFPFQRCWNLTAKRLPWRCMNDEIHAQRMMIDYEQVGLNRLWQNLQNIIVRKDTWLRNVGCSSHTQGRKWNENTRTFNNFQVDFRATWHWKPCCPHAISCYLGWSALWSYKTCRIT